MNEKRRIEIDNLFLSESLGISIEKLKLYRTLEEKVKDLRTLSPISLDSDIKNSFFKENPLFLEIPINKPLNFRR